MSNNLNNKEIYDDLIEKIARRICDLRLETIFIIIFESIKPLSFIASSALVAFEPIINSIFSFKDYERFYRMLEDRENIEKLIRKIEELSEKKVKN
ncbi:MAG: hypothetical protein ABIM58_03185 [candidate division WOR-3 bacterium]